MDANEHSESKPLPRLPIGKYWIVAVLPGPKQKKAHFFLEVKAATEQAEAEPEFTPLGSPDFHIRARSGGPRRRSRPEVTATDSVNLRMMDAELSTSYDPDRVSEEGPAAKAARVVEDALAEHLDDERSAADADDRTEESLMSPEDVDDSEPVLADVSIELPDPEPAPVSTPLPPPPHPAPEPEPALAPEPDPAPVPTDSGLGETDREFFKGDSLYDTLNDDNVEYVKPSSTGRSILLAALVLASLFLIVHLSNFYKLHPDKRFWVQPVEEDALADDGDLLEGDSDGAEEELTDAEWLASLDDRSEPTLKEAPADPEPDQTTAVEADPAAEALPESNKLPHRETIPGCWRFVEVDLAQEGLVFRACLDPSLTATCLGFRHLKDSRVAPYECLGEPPTPPPADCQNVTRPIILNRSWAVMRECNDGLNRRCTKDIDPDTGAHKYCVPLEETVDEEPTTFCRDYQLTFDVHGVPYLVMLDCPDGKNYRCLAAPDNLNGSGQFHGHCFEHAP